MVLAFMKTFGKVFVDKLIRFGKYRAHYLIRYTHAQYEMSRKMAKHGNVLKLDKSLIDTVYILIRKDYHFSMHKLATVM